MAESVPLAVNTCSAPGSSVLPDLVNVLTLIQLIPTGASPLVTPTPSRKAAPLSTAVVSAVSLTVASLSPCVWTTANDAPYESNTLVNWMLVSRSASFWSRLGTVRPGWAPATNVKYRPSPGSTIWFVCPSVVPPPPWPVLTVPPVVMLMSSAVLTGSVPDWLAALWAVTMIVVSLVVGVPSPKARKRFCPDGAPSSENSLRLPTVT